MLMAYIGFFIIMAGLAAAGGALDRGTSLATAIAMTAAGAALMWFFREEGKSEDEEEDNGHASGFGADSDGDGMGSIQEGRVIDMYFPTQEEAEEWMAVTGGKVYVQLVDSEG